MTWNNIGYKRNDFVLFVVLHLYLHYYYFLECNYFKRLLREMSFQITCFIMKLAFYHLASYADELRCCRIDSSGCNGCVTCWLDGCYLWKHLVSRHCFQCTVHQFLSLHPLCHTPHLFNVDRSLSEIG